MESIIGIDTDRYYTIFKNVYAMMRSRKFEPTVPEMSYNDWNSKCTAMIATDLEPSVFMDKLSLFFTKGEEKVMVYFHIIEAKVRKSDMQYIVEYLETNGATQLILVVHKEITTAVNDVMENIPNNPQLFYERELMYNVSRHQYVPKHSCLSLDEKEKILKQYSVTDSQLPAIHVNDPVSRYYNFLVGDVIKIERTNGVYYRVVTNIE